MVVVVRLLLGDDDLGQPLDHTAADPPLLPDRFQLPASIHDSSIIFFGRFMIHRGFCSGIHAILLTLAPLATSSDVNSSTTPFVASRRNTIMLRAGGIATAAKGKHASGHVATALARDRRRRIDVSSSMHAMPQLPSRRDAQALPGLHSSPPQLKPGNAGVEVTSASQATLDQRPAKRKNDTRGKTRCRSAREAIRLAAQGDAALGAWQGGARGDDHADGVGVGVQGLGGRPG